MKKILVSPSVLNVPKEKLLEQSKELEKFGADWIHCDVIDGVFVQNKALELDDVKKLNNAVSLPLDVHLMYQYPQTAIKDFALAGADLITFHYESSCDVRQTCELIKNCGVKAGIALNPSTSVDVLLPYADCFDLILIMSVNPGFGGQRFIAESVDKISQAKQLFPDKLIEVDGGINGETCELAANAGADVLVAGSFIVLSQNVKAAIEKLKSL